MAGAKENGPNKVGVAELMGRATIGIALWRRIEAWKEKDLMGYAYIGRNSCSIL